MVVKEDSCSRLQAPTPASFLHPEQLHFYSGLLQRFHSKSFMATKPLENQRSKSKSFTKCLMYQEKPFLESDAAL